MGPLEEAVTNRSPVVVSDLAKHWGIIPTGPWPEPPHTAVVFHLPGDGAKGGDAALVLGVSSRRALDEDYMEFCRLVAQHVRTAMTAGREFEQEKNRVQELQHLRDHAEASKAQMLATLESITDGFIALDRDWRFTYANGEAERKYGCSRAELIGKNHWDIFPDLWETKVGWEFRRAVREQVSCRLENYYEPCGSGLK